MKCRECHDYDKCVKESNLRIKRKSCKKAKTEYVKTNADHIRAMSIDELNDFLRKVSDHDDDCPYEYGSVKSLEWLGKPYAQKEYKKI